MVWTGLWKSPQQRVTFGHLRPPSLPVDVHDLRPRGLKALIVDRDDGIVDQGTAFGTGALGTRSLCIRRTEVVQTEDKKKKNHTRKGSLGKVD